MKRIYLDHAAATPVDPTILKEVFDCMKKYPANPRALSMEGLGARAVLEEARKEVASALSAHTDEVVFTSGATEANNMAIRGVVEGARLAGVVVPHVIVSTVEHPSVLRLVEVLQSEDVITLDYLPVDERGVVDLKALRKMITKDTVLVSVMYINNEIGTIEPIREIAKEIRHARKVNISVYPYFHTDAAQAENYCSLNVLELGIDLMTLSSGKVYGPRGVGALFVKRSVSLMPLMYGGEHESGRRPGTESPALALGFARALTLALKIKEKETKRLLKVRDALLGEIQKKIPEAIFVSDPEVSSPHIVNILVPGVPSEMLVLYLDAVGVAVSGKSACASSSSEVSHVIVALGKAGAEEAGSLRFSLGRSTTVSDVRVAVRSLADALQIIRGAPQD